MKTSLISLFIAASTFVGCSSASSTSHSPNTGIYGTWMYVNGADSVGFTFTTSGTYSYEQMRMTSDSSFEASIETGTFTQNGSSIALNPVKETCMGLRAPGAATYTFEGDNLILNFSSSLLELTPDTATANTSIDIEYGCFNTDGSFTPEPLTVGGN